jgi:hypothetical protein
MMPDDANPQLWRSRSRRTFKCWPGEQEEAFRIRHLTSDPPRSLKPQKGRTCYRGVLVPASDTVANFRAIASPRLEYRDELITQMGEGRAGKKHPLMARLCGPDDRRESLPIDLYVPLLVTFSFPAPAPLRSLKLV